MKRSDSNNCNKKERKKEMAVIKGQTRADDDRNNRCCYKRRP